MRKNCNLSIFLKYSTCPQLPVGEKVEKYQENGGQKEGKGGAKKGAYEVGKWVEKRDKKGVKRRVQWDVKRGGKIIDKKCQNVGQMGLEKRGK